MPRDPKQKVHKDFNEGIYHRPPTGPSFFVIGVFTAIVLVILSYFAFVKELPFGNPYTVTATFQNAATLRETAPVRIAGVNVGEVTNITLDGEMAEVEFTVDEDGRPLKTDAEVTIRPRLFLEGNYFLDLQPGSPSAPTLSEDGNIPVTRTATAVQLDEVLTTLQQPDRRNLSALLDGYGSALVDPPTPEEDIGHDPDVQGESAAEALNDTFDYGGTAGKTSSQVSEAFLGENPGDLSKLIDDTGVVFSKLASRESELSSLITNFSITVGALAEESDSLSETFAELAPTLEQARPSLAKFNETLPPLRAFARELTPGVKELPATIEAGNPWLNQAIQLFQPNELGTTARILKSTQPNLTEGTYYLTGLLPALGSVSKCTYKVLDPTAETPIEDDFATGVPNYKDFFYTAASQNGAGSNFDGNGMMLRAQTGGGPQLVNAPITGVVAGSRNAPVWGYTIETPTGTQPVRPSSIPPIRADFECAKNEVPDLNGPAAAVGAPMPNAAVSP
jgi:ABC-type transporter Mla subunit MlaD